MLAVISASASASSGLLASMFRPPLENSFSRITCSTCKQVLSERSSTAHGRHAVCLEGVGGDHQEGDQEGHPKNPLSRFLKEFTSAGAGGGGSDIASVDRPEKPGGDPGPGPILLLWRDFRDCFDGLHEAFQTTVLLALATSPVTIPTAAVVSSWKLSKYHSRHQKVLGHKAFDDRFLPIYILGIYVGIVVTGLAFLRPAVASSTSSTYGAPRVCRWSADA